MTNTIITRDGAPVALCWSENNAFGWFLRHTSHSMDHGVEHEGYGVMPFNDATPDQQAAALALNFEQRQGYVGKTDDGDAVYVEIRPEIDRERDSDTVSHGKVTWTLRLSFQGHTFFKGSRRKDSDMGGQCIDMVRAVTKPAEGFTVADLTRLADLWDRWHLNDLRAACTHQTAPPIPEDVNALDRTGWLLDNVEPCEATGYRYGSAWLYEPVPVEVVEELATLVAKLDGTDGFR